MANKKSISWRLSLPDNFHFNHIKQFGEYNLQSYCKDYLLYYQIYLDASFRWSSFILSLFQICFCFNLIILVLHLELLFEKFFVIRLIIHHQLKYDLSFPYDAHAFLYLMITTVFLLFIEVNKRLENNCLLRFWDWCSYDIDFFED